MTALVAWLRVACDLITLEAGGRKKRLRDLHLLGFDIVIGLGQLA